MKGATVTLLDWFVLFAPMEHWIQTAPLVQGFVMPFLLFLYFIVVIHPDPFGPCPCFDDSVCFAGVALGLFLGSVRMRGQDPNRGMNVDLSVSSQIARVLVGSALLLVWKLLSKPLLTAVLKPIWTSFGWPLVYHHFHQHQQRQQPQHPLHSKLHPKKTDMAETPECNNSTLRDAPLESVLSENDSMNEESGKLQSDAMKSATKKGYRIPRHSMDIVIKLTVYSGIGWLAVDILPYYVLCSF